MVVEATISFSKLLKRRSYILAATISVFAMLTILCAEVSASGATSRVPLGTWFRLSDSGGLPTIQVRLGNGPPVRLVLDTGSVGVRVLQSDLRVGSGSTIVLSKKNDSLTFMDGVHLTGVIGHTTVRMGSVSIPNIPFQYVTSVSCSSSYGCPEFSGGGSEQIDGTFGISVARPLRTDPLENPLMALPPSYQHRWQIRYGTSLSGASTGRLLLGSALPSHSTATIHLRPEIGRVTFGSRYWDDMPTLCWSFSSPRRYCGPSRLDSASDVMYVQSNPLPKNLAISATVVPKSIAAGVQVSLYTLRPKSRAFWTYATGDTPDFDSAEALVSSPTFFDSGVQAFYGMTLTYDVSAGQIVVSNSS